MILDKPYFTARKNNGVLFEPDSNCVLWLPGQDDAYSSTIRDRSGNGNDGTITSATWKNDTPGGLWYLSFDGDNDKLSCDGAIGDLDLTRTGDVTVCAWVNRTASSGAQYAIGGFVDGLWNNLLLLEYSDTALTARMRGNNQAAYPAAADSNQHSGWEFAAIVKDGEFLYLVVDGVTLASDTSTGLDDDITITSLDFGWGFSDTYALTGSIWGGRAFSSAKSSTELLGIFNQERHLFNV